MYMYVLYSLYIKVLL